MCLQSDGHCQRPTKEPATAVMALTEKSGFIHWSVKQEGKIMGSFTDNRHALSLRCTRMNKENWNNRNLNTINQTRSAWKKSQKQMPDT